MRKPSNDGTNLSRSIRQDSVNAIAGRHAASGTPGAEFGHVNAPNARFALVNPGLGLREDTSKVALGKPRLPSEAGKKRRYPAVSPEMLGLRGHLRNIARLGPETRSVSGHDAGVKKNLRYFVTDSSVGRILYWT